VVPSRLLDVTLLYTAITRAVEQLVLLGDRAAFERAVAAPPAPMRRETGLGFLIRQ
jgi:exodeoxyribonuclease V alpha subunit